MALRLRFPAIERFADNNRRKHDLAFSQLAVRIVRPFDISPQVAGKIYNLAAGLESAAPSTTTLIVIRRALASVIWLATVRFHIKS